MKEIIKIKKQKSYLSLDLKVQLVDKFTIVEASLQKS